MKKFKLTDFWISCILITVFLVWSLVKLDETFIIGYFVVGGWQVISMIVHAVNSWFTEKGGTRYYYHRIVFLVFVLAGIGYFVIYVLMVVLYIMLFAAPIMAVYYTVLCHEEVYVKMQRPLATLK